MNELTHWRRYILGCAVGNILEWYDFILYGFFSPIFADIFFPVHDEFIGLLLTFAIFATGCFVRPLSSVVFGHVGDTLGRKKTLIITIVLITVATTCMGLLPTYHSVGVFAPVLLVICRLLQGVAVSGEEVGAAVLLSEAAPKEQQAFVGSVVLGSVYIGLFFGALIALFMYGYVGMTVMEAGAWRWPFLAVSVFGILAFWIRVTAVESPEFEALKANKAVLTAPLKILLTVYKSNLIHAISLSAILAVAIYLFAVYLPHYYVSTLHFTHIGSLLLTAVSLLCVSILVPCVGYFADRVGAPIVFMLGCLGFVFFSNLIFELFSIGTMLAACLASCLLIVSLSLIAGSLFPLIMEQFPTNVRYSGACISFNVSMTVFGSTAPIIALSLQHHFHSQVAPFSYLFIAACVSLGSCLFSMKKTSNYVEEMA